MFTIEIYEAEKRVNDLVSESQHYQLVRTLPVTQPKSTRRHWAFLLGPWWRRFHFVGYSNTDRQRVEYQKIMREIS